MSAASWGLGLAVTLALVSLSGYVMLDPSDASEGKAAARYVVAVPANVALSLLALLAFDRARRLPPPSRGAFLAFTVALAGWTIGNWVWLRYNLAGVDVPYPSPSDAAYLAFPVAAALGSAMLLRGARRRLQGVDLAIGAAFPALVFLAFYALLIQPRLDAREDLVRTLTDLAYPTLDAVSLGLAGLVLFFTRSGPLTPTLRRIAAALLLMGVTDGVGLLAIDRGDFFSGSWYDLLYLVSALVFGLTLQATPTAPLVASPKEGRPSAE